MRIKRKRFRRSEQQAYQCNFNISTHWKTNRKPYNQSSVVNRERRKRELRKSNQRTIIKTLIRIETYYVVSRRPYEPPLYRSTSDQYGEKKPLRLCYPSSRTMFRDGGGGGGTGGRGLKKRQKTYRDQRFRLYVVDSNPRHGCVGGGAFVKRATIGRKGGQTRGASYRNVTASGRYSRWLARRRRFWVRFLVWRCWRTGRPSASCCRLWSGRRRHSCWTTGAVGRVAGKTVRHGDGDNDDGGGTAPSGPGRYATATSAGTRGDGDCGGCCGGGGLDRLCAAARKAIADRRTGSSRTGQRNGRTITGCVQRRHGGRWTARLKRRRWLRRRRTASRATRRQHVHHRTTSATCSGRPRDRLRRLSR